jgi:hypothetical protein
MSNFIPSFVLALAALADIVTTRAVMRAGGRELNPIYRGNPTGPVLVLTHALPVVIVLWMHTDPGIRGIAYLGALWYAGLAVHNGGVLKKMKRR